MKESKDLRLEEEARENTNPQEETTTTEEGMKDQTEAVEEKEVNEPDSEEKNEEGENSSTRKILIFSIVGVVATALIITLCIVFASSTRKDKQEEIANQQTNIKEETEEQTTTIEEVAEVEAKSTPEPTAEPTPEPTAEPVEMVSWEEWASQPGEEEPHFVVWNEEKGKQLIIEPGSTYNMEDGDKLAVSASLSKENLEKMTSVLVLKDGGDTKQNIVGTDYGQYIDIDIQKEGKNKVVFFFEDKEYGYIVVK